MYKVVCFKDLSVAIIREEWLTPRKTETFWPPYKHSVDYQRCLSGKEVIPSPPPPTSNQGNTSTDLEKHVTILETQDNSTHFTQALENVAKKLAKICQRLDAIEENQRKILEKVGNECSEPVQEVQNLPEGLIPVQV
ncbi:hypothetical protein FQA39_LY10539 [Lamprigera yunnana]|nr:hypothetical protein FQA39_LY10539 [Lamprigera yunnana]